ncbi:hypothetical protein OIU79_021049 [Salix purpurea]|uniref:Uncharacterized protein n=1 Tax=Salix purpurea TaxID=77065 RepID=A0A9Q0WRC5_SALPP|nr:hypothetical protein OIU79_021049 [Salix purpurea]
MKQKLLRQLRSGPVYMQVVHNCMVGTYLLMTLDVCF